ncbi:MAG: DUF2851 family protein [Bacteroidota bacterium]
MKEDFLHFIWKEQLFNTSNLKTCEGSAISIIDKGHYNHHSGPDFFNCQIKLDHLLWVGNVEIHLRSSDWYRHKHQEDIAYDNVILHVVLENDMEVYRSNGTTIPTLSLKDKFYKESYLRYERFFNSGTLMYPCIQNLSKVPKKIIEDTLSKNLENRILKNTSTIKDQLVITNNHWEEAFYHLLAKAFGFKVNAVPLQLLAETIPYTIIERESNDIFKIESLLFGVAGLLNTIEASPYLSKLKTEFKHQQKKYSLDALHPSIWKFGKLRPSNFPTIRISQLSMLLYKQKRLFKRCIHSNTIEDVKKLLITEASDYWATHYHFEKSTQPIVKHLGEESINGIIINCIVPFCYAYGLQIGNHEIQRKAHEWLKQLPAEKNKFTKLWNNASVQFINSSETQGLIQLNNSYCMKDKCVYCKIGSSILNLNFDQCEKIA